MTVLKYFQDEGLVEYVFSLRRTLLRRILSDVITACPNLVNLWVYTDELIYGKNFFAVFSPQITRLAIRLCVLLEQLSSSTKASKPDNPNPPNPIFPGITHILVFGEPFEDHKEDAQSQLLSIHFPNLTHLALATTYAVRQKEGIRLTSERCKKLELVVLMRPLRIPPGYRTWLEHRPVTDSKVMELPDHNDGLSPWKANVRGDGMDLWEIANWHRGISKPQRNRRVQ